MSRVEITIKNLPNNEDELEKSLDAICNLLRGEYEFDLGVAEIEDDMEMREARNGED